MIRVIKGGDRQAYDPPARLSAMQAAVLKAEDVKARGTSELRELAEIFRTAVDAAQTPRERVRQAERLRRIEVELERR